MVGKLKISLALSGGAARGAFHLGAIEAMQTLGVSIEAVSGTSIGAVIAVGLGCGLSPGGMLEIFKSKAFRKSIQFNYFQKGLLRIDEKAAILNTLAPIENLEDCKIPTFVSCVDVLSGKIVRFSSGKAIPLAIASSALLPLFKPVRYGKYLLIDGCFMDNLPISPLEKFDYPIVSIDLHPLLPIQEHHFFALYRRSLFLSFIASSQAQKDKSALYITSSHLPSFGLFRLDRLDECYQLGYDTAYKEVSAFLSQKNGIMTPF